MTFHGNNKVIKTTHIHHGKLRPWHHDASPATFIRSFLGRRWIPHRSKVGRYISPGRRCFLYQFSLYTLSYCHARLYYIEFKLSMYVYMLVYMINFQNGWNAVLSVVASQALHLEARRAETHTKSSPLSLRRRQLLPVENIGVRSVDRWPLCGERALGKGSLWKVSGL